MIFGLFTLLVALTISAVAAYYSIAGLCAIFAAAVVPIIIMGAALELGKITATVWLHKYWHRCALQFKLYLVPAIVVLMIITSMGIFGFLSKAHMDQGVTVGDSAAQVSVFDEKIKTERDNIETARKALQQMDAQVDQMLGRTTDDRGAERAVQIRRNQAKERKNLQNEIAQAQKNISALQAERAPLAAQSRKIEAEVGPVKYIAALIYGDNPDANLLERAVRWVIILLVLVFDPLALVLILAAEQTIEWARADRKAKKAQDDARQGWHQEWVPDTENPWRNEPAYEPDDGSLTDEQIQTIKDAANVDLGNVVTTKTLFDTPKEFFEHGQELAQSIDANNGYIPSDELIGQLESKEKELASAQAEIDQLKAKTADMERQLIVKRLVEQPNIASVSFGTEFPKNPSKGSLYLMVNQFPSVLYKWNGGNWMEVDKDITDSYAYDEAYIKFLIEKIDSGEYDPEYLTEAEQDQIQRFLNGNSN